MAKVYSSRLSSSESSSGCCCWLSFFSSSSSLSSARRRRSTTERRPTPPPPTRRRRRPRTRPIGRGRCRPSVVTLEPAAESFHAGSRRRGRSTLSRGWTRSPKTSGRTTRSKRSTTRSYCGRHWRPARVYINRCLRQIWNISFVLEVVIPPESINERSVTIPAQSRRTYQLNTKSNPNP